MGPFLVVAIAALAGGLVLLALLGRYHEAAWLEEWEEILTPNGQQRYEELRQRFDREYAASQFTYQRARAAFERGDDAAALELLDAEREFMIGLAPERARLLRDLARYARMMGAVAPLPPLRPGQFRLSEVATLAGAGWLVHHFLVTVPERARLRLAILRRGQAMVLRALPVSEHRHGGRLDLRDWKRIEAARADWSTLDQECLQSFRSLVTALVGPMAWPEPRR